MIFSKNKDTFKRIIAIILLLSFVVPSILFAAHYTVIEHLPLMHHSNAEFHNHHINCKLDDYAFGKTTQNAYYSKLIFAFENVNQIVQEVEIIISEYNNYIFLLRAPPIFI